MIKIIGKLPKKVNVAFSGGVDSTAVVDFLSNNHDVECFFFNHGTTDCADAERFVRSFCSERDIALNVGYVNRLRNPDESPEEFWRNTRYEYLDSLGIDLITAHNLDDCVETYIYSSLHGTAKVIPFSRNKITRPFLLTEKKDFVNWANNHNLSWYEEKSNSDNKFMRNFIRNQLVPQALVVNPGLYKTVRKIVQKKI